MYIFQSNAYRKEGSVFCPKYPRSNCENSPDMATVCRLMQCCKLDLQRQGATSEERNYRTNHFPLNYWYTSCIPTILHFCNQILYRVKESHKKYTVVWPCTPWLPPVWYHCTWTGMEPLAVWKNFKSKHCLRKTV